MHRSMKSLRMGALAVILAAGTIGVTATVSFADVACNGAGECWNTKQRYTDYPANLNVQFYGDDWRKAHEHDAQYHWMKDRSNDHGYYSQGEWHDIQK